MLPRRRTSALPMGSARISFFDLYARTTAAGIAHRCGLVQKHARIQHLPAFVLVRRCHEHQVWQAAHVSEIETARMRGAVRAHQTGTVDGEQHREVLQRHIVHQLVVSPLQKSGVDGDNGF